MNLLTTTLIAMTLSNTIICPECKQYGLKSIVTQTGAQETLAYCPPRWDGSGNQIEKNSACNQITFEYRCSEGHVWMVKR